MITSLPIFSHHPLYTKINVKSIVVELQKTQRVCPLVILSESQKNFAKNQARERSIHSESCNDKISHLSSFLKDKCEFNGVALELAYCYYFNLPFLPDFNRFHNLPDICGPEGFGSDVRHASDIDLSLIVRFKDRNEFPMFSGALDPKSGGYILIGWEFVWKIKEWQEILFNDKLVASGVERGKTALIKKEMSNPNLEIQYPRCRLNPVDTFNPSYFR